MFLLDTAVFNYFFFLWLLNSWFPWLVTFSTLAFVGWAFPWIRDYYWLVLTWSARFTRRLTSDFLHWSWYHVKQGVLKHIAPQWALHASRAFTRNKAWQLQHVRHFPHASRSKVHSTRRAPSHSEELSNDSSDDSSGGSSDNSSNDSE